MSGNLDFMFARVIKGLQVQESQEKKPYETRNSSDSASDDNSKKKR